MTPAQRWRDDLRRSLTAARKARDTQHVAALRSALSAIDNAETPDVAESARRAAGPIAGAATGLGAAEVARRVLSDSEIRDLIQTEIDERFSAAAEFVALGQLTRAADLRSQALVLAEALNQTPGNV